MITQNFVFNQFTPRKLIMSLRSERRMGVKEILKPLGETVNEILNMKKGINVYSCPEDRGEV